MILIEEISETYSITLLDIVMICLLVFFFFFLLYCVFRLYNDNQRYKEKVKELESKNKELKEKYDKINKLANEIYVKRENITNKNSAYQKNIFKTMKSTTSPVGIEKKKNNDKVFVSNNKINIDDLIKKEKTILDDIKPICDIKPSNSKSTMYMEEVQNRLKDATENVPIELTDYEIKQEEEAIISYQELIDNKDKLNIIDDEADIEFINDLKKFRDSLNDK